MTCTSLNYIYVCWVLTNARSSQLCLPAWSGDNLASYFTEKIGAIGQAFPQLINVSAVLSILSAFPLLSWTTRPYSHLGPISSLGFCILSPPTSSDALLYCIILVILNSHFKEWACLRTNAGFSLLPQSPHTYHFLFLEQLFYCISFTYHNSYSLFRSIQRDDCNINTIIWSLHIQ